jgi:hypothetical protein
MQEGDSQSQGKYAWADEADSGSVRFDFELECPAELYVWGVVWDSLAGAHGWGDPDSFWATMNDNGMDQWVYGCQTGNVGDGEWSWQRVMDIPDAQFCNFDDVTYNLGAGQHFFRLHAREADLNEYDLAAVARVLLTTDPNYVPNINNE